MVDIIGQGGGEGLGEVVVVHSWGGREERGRVRGVEGQKGGGGKPVKFLHFSDPLHFITPAANINRKENH